MCTERARAPEALGGPAAGGVVVLQYEFWDQLRPVLLERPELPEGAAPDAAMAEAARAEGGGGAPPDVVPGEGEQRVK